MTAVVDRVACPECGAQKELLCVDWEGDEGWLSTDEPHQARRDALYALLRREEAERRPR